MKLRSKPQLAAGQATDGQLRRWVSQAGGQAAESSFCKSDSKSWTKSTGRVYRGMFGGLRFRPPHVFQKALQSIRTCLSMATSYSTTCTIPQHGSICSISRTHHLLYHELETVPRESMIEMGRLGNAAGCPLRSVGPQPQRP